MSEEKYRVILYDDQIMAENMSYGTPRPVQVNL